MKLLQQTLPRAVCSFFLFTLLCGIFYTGLVTGLAQIFFPYQANGSIIEIDGVSYGSELLGQQFSDERHMWGRIMNPDVVTCQDSAGKYIMYATPSNLSPASTEYQLLIAERVDMLRKAHPEKEGIPVPVDLVTCSGSGLDPHISPAAAEYQVPRLARENAMTEEEVRSIIDKCTEDKFLGIFGEKTVHVLRVNLMLEGILS